MKISVPLQDPLSLPHGEQPAKRSCRQYSAITCSVLESLDCPKEKQQLWWNRLGPASSTDCVPPDDRAMAKETLNCIQPRLTWNYVASDSDHKLQRLAQVTSSPFQGQRQGHVEFVQDHTSPAETDVTMEKFVDRRHTDPSLSDEERCSPSSVLISESHCEQQCPESASENASLPRLKFLCSFGGRIMARPVDGKLRYAGGETRIVSVCKGISFTEFMSKMSQVYGYPLGLKYQLPDQGLDALISVSSDDDLQNMVEEHDKIEPSGVASSRLRLFFFTTPADVELAEAKVESGNCVSFPDQRYVDAINGLPAKHQANLPEEDTPALHPMVTVNSTDGGGRIPSLEQANEVTQCSAISSSPSSPLTSGQAAFRKPPGLLDLSLQNVNESHCKATMASFAFEGEIDQDVLGGSLSTPFHYHYDPSHFDLPFSQVTDSSPRISVPDGSSLRNGENRPGLHCVDSKSGIAYLPDHEYRSSLGPPLEHWQEGSYVHDLTSPQADHQHGNQLYTVSLASPHQSYHSHPHQQIQHQHQHQHQQHHHQLYIHQPQQQYHRHQQHQHHHGYQEHQSHQHQGSWSPRNERDADRGEYAHQEVHKQSQYHQFSHHHLVRNSPVPASCSWNAEHPGTPRSNQLSAQVLHGLAPAPPYQMGSAPCPSQGVHDYQAKCPCGLQHSQVHRGITVSMGEQPYTRRPAFQDDHGARKQALRTSSRFYDNGTHGVDAGVWQQANHSILPCEVEHKESNNEWPLRLGRHLRDLQSPDCSARNQPHCRNGEILPAHERPETGMGCLCSNCADNRRQQMEMAKGHSTYMEVSDCAPDQSLSRKGFDLDVGRVATCQPVFPRAPAPKDGEQSNVHEKIFEVEPGLCASQLRWDPDSRLQIATHIDRPRKVQLSSGTATGSFGVSNKPMLPLVPRAAQRSSNLTKTPSELAISRSLASSEARYHYDIPPCQQGQQMQLGKDLQTMVLDESLPEATGEEDLNKHFGLSDTNSCASMSISFCWDDVSSGPGRVESDARHPWSPNCKLDWADQGANDVFLAGQRDLQLSSPDVITLGSVVEVSNSGQVLDSHIFAQSPYRSANMSKFSFAAGKPLASPQDRIVDKEPFAPDMSVTGELADSMASSVLDCCSDETMAWEMSDLDQETASLPREEEKVTKAKEDTDTISGEPNIGKLQLGEDCEDKLASMNGETLKDVMEVVIDEVGVTKGLVEANTSEDSGVTLVILSGGQSDKTSHQKEAVITERNGPSLSQAEAEAITRGLQIIRNSDLEDTKELGSGTYGTVYHGKWRGSDVAIKRIKASCFTGPPADQERLITDFWREACTLGQLHHPNVVAFYGVVPDGPGGTLATVTEYMVNGSLKQVLHKKDRTIDRRKRLFIAMDAAFGMEYLHSKNIVHFDLKCENLLVNMKDAHRPICKVGDFGLSKVKHHTLVSGGVRGTLPWMAPELLSGNGGMVSEKVDVFSFGIVMWELLTGEEPYANMHCGAIIGGIANNTLRPSIPSWCDPGWRSIMERCWSDNPADRPPFAEIAKELRAIAATMNLK